MKVLITSQKNGQKCVAGISQIYYQRSHYLSLIMSINCILAKSGNTELELKYSALLTPTRFNHCFITIYRKIKPFFFLSFIQYVIPVRAIKRTETHNIGITIKVIFVPNLSSYSVSELNNTYNLYVNNDNWLSGVNIYIKNLSFIWIRCFVYFKMMSREIKTKYICTILSAYPYKYTQVQRYILCNSVSKLFEIRSNNYSLK